MVKTGRGRPWESYYLRHGQSSERRVDSVRHTDLAQGGPLGNGKIALYNCTNPIAYDNVEVSALAVTAGGKLATTWGVVKTAY